MSQQINLYDASLLRKRELLTALNIAVVSGSMVVLLGAWGAVARSQLGGLESESRALSPQAQVLQAQKEAMAAQLAAMKPDPQLETELANAKSLLDLHTRQVSELKKGLGNESGGFAEYLRGFARQIPAGLWLTGFAIADSGASMEIHGRMTDPALLPEYIRRLNGEQAFKGREFSALKVSAGKPDEPSPPAAQAPAPAVAAQPSAPASPAPAAAVPASSSPAPFYEFSLSPLLAASAAASGSGPGGARTPTGGPR